MSKAPRRGMVLAAMWCLCVLPRPAEAVLGEPVASVHADQMRLQGSRRVISALRYQVHDIRSADGAIVKQYANSSGQVFCVNWRSQLKPNLASLLGQSFGDYTVATSKAAPARGYARRNDIQSGNLVVNEVQHLGVFSGQACLRNLIPQGVAAHELR
jgi:hypothetical protein